MAYPLVILEIDCNWQESKLNSKLEHLPEQVRTRASRYRSRQARRNLIVTQYRIFQVLAVLGISSQRLATANNGRPFDLENKLQFNLSHCHERAFLALSLDPALKHGLGIDTEWAERKLNHQALSKRFFTAEEIAWIKGRSWRFFWVWTRKEAVLKSSGVGLRVGLDGFSVLESGLQDLVTGRRLSLESKIIPDSYILSWSLSSAPSQTHYLRDCSSSWQAELAFALKPKGQDKKRWQPN